MVGGVKHEWSDQCGSHYIIRGGMREAGPRGGGAKREQQADLSVGECHGDRTRHELVDSGKREREGPRFHSPCCTASGMPSTMDHGGAALGF